MIANEVAQTLSAYEWTVVALPIRQDQTSSGVGIRQTTDFDVFNSEAGGVQMQPKAVIVMWI